MAWDRLESARDSLASGFPSAAVSSAYYAMLYATRAALSEEDRYAKTHSGTWNLFRQAFVNEGRFDGALFASAQQTQRVREGTDYDAVAVTSTEASEVVVLAGRFVTAVVASLEPPAA